MKNTINKIIIWLLAVILVMPISPILTQAESVFDVFDPERYVVIQNIVQEKMQEYGELEEEKWPGMSYSKGLVYVDLVDFNEDLIPELVLAYCDKSATSASEYVVEVWDCTDIDNPTCAVQETGFSMDMDRTSVCIVESLEKNYLLTGTIRILL